MSAGLPVVTTAVGGSKEVIENGTNSLLVPPGNPEALARSFV
jgi:glycosyltransferase involved in cell wall biosynthesis